MSKIALDMFQKIEQIAAARTIAYDEVGYEFNTETFFNDLTYAEVLPLIGSTYLGDGSHKICFRKGNKVYSLFHLDEDEKLSILNQNLKSSIWPKVKHVTGKLYVMPFYKIISEYQFTVAQAEIMSTLSKLGNISEAIEPDNKFYHMLPKYIINGLNEAIKIGPLNCDVHCFNVGWQGDKPVLFDAYWFEHIR